MAVPPKKEVRGQKSASGGVSHPQRTRFSTLRRLPSGSTGPNDKSIDDGCKVFFLENQFSLAFDEKKRILRNEKRALEVLVSCLEEIKK
jgi:hypothetical protein